MILRIPNVNTAAYAPEAPPQVRSLPAVEVLRQIWVQQYYGPPTAVWPEADGGHTLEYATQPFGRTCYMVRLDAQDRFVSSVDGLSAASRARIVPGMSPEQVNRILGRERTRVFFKLSGEDVWDWNIEPEMNGYLLRFNVHFKKGIVVRTSQSVVYPDRRFLWDD